MEQCKKDWVAAKAAKVRVSLEAVLDDKAKENIIADALVDALFSSDDVGARLKRRFGPTYEGWLSEAEALWDKRCAAQPPPADVLMWAARCMELLNFGFSLTEGE